MNKIKKIKKIKKFYLILISLIIVVSVGVIIYKIIQSKTSNQLVGNLNYTLEEEDKVTIEYYNSYTLDNLVTPIEEAQFIKAFENFISVDIQNVLNNDKDVASYFNIVYKNKTCAKIDKIFYISQDSILNLLSKLQNYKGIELGTNIIKCEFSYNKDENDCNLIITFKDGYNFTGIIKLDSKILKLEF